MKRLSVIFAILLLSHLTAWAQTTQPCVVRQYNQQQQKTPLAGVQVEVRDAGSAVSASDGTLTLRFATLQPGDRVTVRRIQKSGYEIFNTTALEQWNISRHHEVFEIVMVRTDYFTQLRSKISESSADNYKKKYEQAKRELEQLQQEGKLREDEYRQQMLDLEDRYDHALQNLDTYIEQFVRIDLSKVSDEEQRIIAMVEAGHIDEAVRAYDRLNISEKLHEAREAMFKLDDARRKVDERRARQALAISDLKSRLKREIATLRLAGGPDSYARVARLLKENALADTTDFEALSDYASFCFEQKNFGEAERYWLRSLNYCQGDIRQQAVALNGLGSVGMMMHNYNKALDYLNRALAIRTLLSNDDPLGNSDELSATQCNIGNVHLSLQDSHTARDYYLQSLRSIECLENVSPEEYHRGMSMTLNSLGGLYFDTHDYAESERCYLQSAEHFALLYAQKPETYRQGYSNTLNNVGNLYATIYNYSKALDYFRQAMELRKTLFEQNPDAYRDDFGVTLNSLADLYNEIGDYDRAEQYFLDALNHREILFKQDPDAFRIDVAYTQEHLGRMYNNMGRYDVSELYFQEALAHYQLLCDQNPEAFRVFLATAQNEIGHLYVDMDDYARAEEYYLLALDNFKLLCRQNYEANLPDLAKVQRNLAILYGYMGDFRKSDDLFWQSIDNQNRLIKRKSDVYRADLASTQYSLARMYVEWDDNRWAEKVYRQALDNYALLYEQNPNVYASDYLRVLSGVSYFYARIRRYDDALLLIDRAIDLFPNQASNYDTKGEILLMRGDTRGALDLWHIAVSVDPDYLNSQGGTTPLYEQLKDRGLLNPE